MLTEQQNRQLAAIRLLCLDVDGVLTDGRLFYGSDGSEYKAFNAQDGHALKMLASSGVQLAIISGRSSSMVQRRAQELGIHHLYEGCDKKAEALGELLEATGLAAQEIAHVGDDLPDLDLFVRVGCALSVADAHPEVRARADLVATLGGGNGAVRELCQLIMQAQGTWPNLPN